MMQYDYEVIPPPGQLGGLIAPACCRYDRKTELSLLEAGYIIRLHGKKITKTELRKEHNGNDQRKPQRRI